MAESNTQAIYQTSVFFMLHAMHDVCRFE